MPTSAAAPGSTAPWKAYVIDPVIAVTITAVNEVAAARLAANAHKIVSAGTITIPPPTPNRAPRKPAASPIRSRRTRLLYGRGRAGTPRLRAGARRPLPRHRRRPRADRRRPRRRARARRDLRRRARPGAGAGGGGVGQADPRVRGPRPMAGRGQAAHGRVPLPHRRAARRGAGGARGGGRRGARRGLPDALGADGARGSAAGRRVEGD